MPTPRKGEKRKDFVNRCIPIVLDEGTAESGEQAAAICHSMWRESKKELGMSNEVTINIGTEAEPAKEMGTASGSGSHTPSVSTSWLDEVVDMVGKRLGLITKETTEQDTSGLMLWKEADGQYHWIARYSNNFRDEDNPPEIIAAKSHRRFVDLVDTKQVDPPELWLWHIEDWKWGQAEWVAWDDAGFALAGGTVDKGKEPLAEALAALPPDALRVSHGMPKESIKRADDDSTIIVEHLTREISPLPAFAAANPMTGFIMSKEAKDMAIPQEKLDELQTEWNLSDEILGTLQAANAAEAEEGKQAGIEQKDKSDEEPEKAAEEVAEVEAKEEETDAEEESKDTKPLDPPPEVEAETEPAEETPEPEGVSRDEMQAALEAIAQSITALSEQIKEVKGEVVEVKEEKSVKEALTLSEIFERAIGHQDARVDGRTSQAKDRPAETQDEEPGVINSGNPLADSVINNIVSGAWREGLDTPQ